MIDFDIEQFFQLIKKLYSDLKYISENVYIN